MYRNEFNDFIEDRLEGMYNILESSDVVMEFLKFKKKDKGDYSITTINKEINAIKKDIKEIIASNEDIKEFYNKGIKITSNRDTFEFADEKDGEQYHSGCVFYVIDVNLDDYKDGGVSSRGKNPLDGALLKLEKLTRKLIKNKLS